MKKVILIITVFLLVSCHKNIDSDIVYPSMEFKGLDIHEDIVQFSFIMSCGDGSLGDLMLTGLTSSYYLYDNNEIIRSVTWDNGIFSCQPQCQNIKTLNLNRILFSEGRNYTLIYEMDLILPGVDKVKKIESKAKFKI